MSMPAFAEKQPQQYNFLKNQTEEETHPFVEMDKIVFNFIDLVANDALSDEATILIVEDEPIINDLLADLMRDNGFSTIQATSAEQAVPFLTDDSQRIDLMLSDVGLPGMDGHELLHVARDYRPNLKVLFVTGNAADRILAEEIKDEDTDVMAKPFSMDEVTEHVTALL